MEDYSAAMDRAVCRYREEGVTHFIFGDIFLHDVRRYREEPGSPLRASRSSNRSGARVRSRSCAVSSRRDSGPSS